MNDFTFSKLASLVIDGLEDGIDKLGVIQPLATTAKSIRDELAIRKVVSVLEAVKDLSSAQRSAAMFNITSTMNDERVGDLLITYIDRIETPKIATMIGRAFYALGTDRITAEEFWSIAYALSVLPTFAIQSLYRNENGVVGGKYNELFAAAGIATLVDGGGFGGGGGFFTLTGRLGRILIELREDETVHRYSPEPLPKQ